MFEYIVDYNLKPAGRYTPRAKTKRILLHHTSGGSKETVQGIHAYHLSKGHKGIDYNICVQQDGTVAWGRGLEYSGGSVNNSNPPTKGMNNDSVAIAALGDFERNEMPEVQKEAVLRVVRDVAQYYGITEIKGHCEVAGRDYTDCPGRYFPLDEARRCAIDVEDEPAQPEAGEYEFALGRLLKLCSPMLRGDDVQAVQRTLALNYGYDIVRDGIYGKKTKAAVEDFQGKSGLKKDGIVGKATCGALNGRWDG